METDLIDRPASRISRFRHVTRDLHEDLDSTIGSHDPFRDRDSYGRFLRMQFHFMYAVEPFYRDSDWASRLPDLPVRSRLFAVIEDMTDLELPIPSPIRTPVDTRQALGWIYVSEGSKMGAAFLLKAAAKIGLTEEFGARHLAGAPEGRGRHWRVFTDAINEVELTDEDDQHALTGAAAAFQHVRSLVDQSFSPTT